MEKNITRRDLLKKSLKAGALIGGAAVIGAGAYKFLKVNPIEDLYGP